jgi:hypothetical protein
MTPPAHFAIFSRSAAVSFADVQRIAAACDAQMKEDFYPIWQRHADVIASDNEADVPPHVWKVVIEDDIGEPGALGFHNDELGQPVCYISAQNGDLDAVATTCSHEIIEATCDPYGNRLIPSWHPQTNVPVRILCEPCDPSEDKSYEKNGLQVSDFYCPEWFDREATPGQKYTFLDAIQSPRQIIAGGYMSFVDAQGQWWQLTSFDGGEPQLQGPFDWKLDATHHSLRAIVDESVRQRKAA